MEEPPKMGAEEGEKGGSIASIEEEILDNILSRLPAISFAYAACVSRSWHRLCNDILNRPKLLSALSLNPSLEAAAKEVFDKVLSEPIRPHFAIVCVGWKFSLKKTHQLVTKKLGSGIPIIISEARGIIGSDAITDEFREVQWEEDENTMSVEDYNSRGNVDRGIILIVGFVPGLKVHAFPLLRSSEDAHQVSRIDKFVLDIKDYAVSVSDNTSPAAILMFGDENSELKPVLEKMDYALSGETVIVGNENAFFIYSNGDDPRIFSGSQKYLKSKIREQSCQSCNCEAVALVFAKDTAKSDGKGEIHFNLAFSTGLSPIGPTYKGVSIVARNKVSEYSTWLTAKREGSLEQLDGQRILNDIDAEHAGYDILCGDLYIGVAKQRKCSIGLEKRRRTSSLVLHEVLGADKEYLYVKGTGISTGDSFRFYRPNPEAAIVSRNRVFDEFRILKQDWSYKGLNLARRANEGQKKEICGGLIFPCCGRGESFFGRRNFDSSVILENFPGVPLAGMFCFGEIGRGSSLSTQKEVGNEQNPSPCCLHVYSCVYLIMLYTEKPLGG